MQGQNRKKSSSLFKRLERLRQTQALTWDQVSEKLGVSVAMLMMVKAGSRNLSEKVLARLELSEVEAGLKSPAELSEHAKALDKRPEAPVQLVTESDVQKGYLDFRPQYRPETKSSSTSETIRLLRPDSAGRNRLGIVIAKSFDSDIVLLACLPDEFRNQAFLEGLTLSSRTLLHNAAMALVFGKEWRTTVAKLAVEHSIGDRTAIDQILGNG
ncbi:MAG TPA: helix-turn-helix transcriptional regulator [Verrucomicrobiae bacterium]|nr:helix-turn-helix transcriptional regulator [Verrucomicrobiae bacterium]